MSVLRMIYLALAVWGAIHPMYYFIQWFQAEGWDIMKMVDAWHTNMASSGLVWDLTIAAITLTVWILAEAFTRRNWSALIAIPATFCHWGKLWLAALSVFAFTPSGLSGKGASPRLSKLSLPRSLSGKMKRGGG